MARSPGSLPDYLCHDSGQLSFTCQVLEMYYVCVRLRLRQTEADTATREERSRERWWVLCMYLCGSVRLYVNTYVEVKGQ